MRRMLKSKIHRAVVTDANVEYEGSLTIDKSLMEAADIIPFEQVACWNVTNGKRFTTYAIVGEAGSGVICVNGAAAHLAKPKDLLIITTFVDLPEEEARRHEPVIVLLKAANVIKG